jgi:hypothetical protein
MRKRLNSRSISVLNSVKRKSKNVTSLRISGETSPFTAVLNCAILAISVEIICDKVTIKKVNRANIIYQIEQLKESPVFAKLIFKNKLKIVVGYSNLKTGRTNFIG